MNISYLVFVIFIKKLCWKFNLCKSSKKIKIFRLGHFNWFIYVVVVVFIVYLPHTYMYTLLLLPLLFLFFFVSQLPASAYIWMFCLWQTEPQLDGQALTNEQKCDCKWVTLTVFFHFTILYIFFWFEKYVNNKRTTENN